MASCPLCGAQMTIDTCPRCVGVHMDGGEYERRMRALDPLSTRDDGPEPIVVETKEADEHGYVPAAAIFGAQGVAALLVAGVGAPPDLGLAAVSLVVAAALVKGSGWAKWMVVVGAALNVAQLVALFVLTGSWLAIFAMLPSVCVLGAFWFDGPRQRVGASVAGVALAFAWLGLVAVKGEARGSGDDELAQYALAGGTWSDPSVGLAVAAPPGLTLYDVQKARDSLMGERAGLLGMLAKDALVHRGAGERLAVRSAKEELVALVATGTVPAQVATESVLPSLLQGESRTERDDRLVPRAMRDAGLSAQAWRSATQRALILRAPDGRMVSVVCGIHQIAGERLCDLLFAGVSLTPGKPAAAGKAPPR